MESKAVQPSMLSTPSEMPGVDFSELLDENDTENEISALERMISTIDINVSSTQRNLEDIYKYKSDLLGIDSYSSKPFLLRRTRSLLDKIGCRTIVTTTTNLQSVHSLDIDDALVLQTKNGIQHLLRERRTLAANLKRRQAQLVHRNRGLPIELWAKIFQLCLPDEEFIDPDPHHAPLLLCGICRQWRHIALGTPLLWHSLSIRASWTQRISKSSLENWLSCSAHVPLSLDISIPTFMDEGSLESHLLKTIMATAYRWKHLRLSLSSTLLRTILNNPMPLLRILEFSSAEHILSLHLQPGQVPNLRIISSLTKAVYLQHLFLPWVQLTHISSQCWLNIYQHVSILSNCPNLESYSMSLIHSDRPRRYDMKKLVHLKLQVLHITSFVENPTGQTVDLETLQLPSLVDLTLVVPNECPGYGIISWPKAAILSLIQRSSCSLSTLCFRGVSANEDDMRDAKDAIPLPTVIHFHCYGLSYTDI